MIELQFYPCPSMPLMTCLQSPSFRTLWLDIDLCHQTDLAWRGLLASGKIVSHCVTLCQVVSHSVTLSDTVSHSVTLSDTVSHSVTLCDTLSSAVSSLARSLSDRGPPGTNRLGGTVHNIVYSWWCNQTQNLKNLIMLIAKKGITS